MTAFGDQMHDPRYKSRRLAFVVGGSAAIVQVRRLLDREDIGCFVDRAAAEYWLVRADAVAA